MKNWKRSIWIIGLAAGMALTMVGPLAWAGEPSFEKSADFAKSKLEFGQGALLLSLAETEDGKEAAAPVAKAKPKHEAPAWLKGKKVGGWGGPAVGNLQMDMTVFDPITDERELNRFNDAMYPVGGFGVGRIGNLRIGGMGFGAGQEQEKIVKDDPRKAEVNIGFGGLVLEYIFEPTPKLGIIAGTMLGGGGIGLSAEGLDLSVSGGDTVEKWEANDGFVAAYPYLGVSLKVLPFMRVEATYGWFFFDYNPSGNEYRLPVLDTKAVDGTLAGNGSAQVRFIFGYETEVK